MNRWTARDWTSVIIGWVCSMLAVVLIPVWPFKLVLVFVAGFVSAWIARLLIPH